MDVLNIDLQLKSEATRKKSKAKQNISAYDESEAGFHFIAFVPAKGRVWKFDGLERQPQSLGVSLLSRV
jgi:ubiquitin carboxyl-terminal hydrolase L5